MLNRTKLSMCLAVVGCMAILGLPISSYPAVPLVINYQGQLRDNLGAQVPDGLYDMIFKIYDDSTAGSNLWTEVHVGPNQVQVTNGLFTVSLGSISPSPLDVFTPGSDRFLGVTVGADAEMARVRLASVPFAFQSLRSDTAAFALNATGSFLPLAGGTMTGPISSTGSPAITMGAGNFGTNNSNSGGGSAFVAGENNNATGGFSSVAGGHFNTASGFRSHVSGGWSNTAASSESFVGGGSQNTANGGVICGGQRNSAGPADFVGGGSNDTASGGSSVVAGGQQNVASGSVSTVGGGIANRASGQRTTVSGGTVNTASGYAATVPGGESNVASAFYSFAAGRRAKANHHGSFVWADQNDVDFVSSNTNQFSVRCTNGARFVTTIDGSGNPTAGVELFGGSGSWSSLSDSAAKEHFEVVDGTELLSRLASIPITTWKYKAQDKTIRHIGPMAQDFHRSFGVGEDDKHITTVDADGVALAAIQQLNRDNQAQAAEIATLKVQLAELRKLLESRISIRQ